MNISENKEHLIKEKLIVEIYTIGYEPMGESILFFIKGDNVVLFSGVIDCFEKENVNKTLEILDANQVETVDFICLTHPDEDHCKGLDKIIKKSGSETYIIYPNGLFRVIEEKGNKNAGVLKSVEELSKCLAKRKDDITKSKKIIGCSGKKEIISDNKISFKSLSTGNTYPFIINTYTPVSEIIDRYSAKSLLGLKAGETSYNNLSIVTAIAIGDFKMLLCGDVENDTLELWTEEWNSDDEIFFSGVMDYLKIPHHTSRGSDILLQSLNKVRIFSNSVTTVFRNCSLPDEGLLKRYKNKSDKLYCTGKIKKEKIRKDCGIVKMTVDIFNRSIKNEVFGDADEISEL
ncbi:MAG: hypothetical protein ACLR4X_07020 [Clostridia bacterium]